MKRLILLSAMFSATGAYASSGGANLGASSTTGPSSNPYSLSTAFHNPAMGSLAVRKDEKVRFSLFPTAGFNIEYGQVDGFIDDLEELADLLDDDADKTNVDQTLDDFNTNILPKIGEAGYMKMQGGGSLPLVPMYFKSDLLNGTLGFDVSVDLLGAMQVIDGVEGEGLNKKGDLKFEVDPITQKASFSTSTSIYLKSGVDTTFALSYSRKVYQNNYGTLYAGGKLKYTNMQLSKQVIPLTELAGEDLGDLIVDRYDENQNSSSAFGMDFGAVWDAKRYRIGLVAENINSPEFEYGAIGTNCGTVSSCYLESYLIDEHGEIARNEVHIKDATMRVDGLFKLTERLQVSGAYDLSVYNDAIGYEHQWMHAAVSYDSDYFLLPSLRIGYQENLAGTKTSSLMFGTTLFKIISADFEVGLDNVTINDTEVPRRFGFALSIQEHF